MKNIKKKVGFISLGCDKNRVDLEKIIHGFKKKGYEITNDENLANVIVINTCGFISDAKRESIDAVIHAGTLKQNKNLECLAVCGCLVNNMNENELKKELPEVDVWVNIASKTDVISAVENFLNKSKLQNKKTVQERILTTPNHFAYLKIADGCNNFCTYCLIPKIKGPFKSEKMSLLIKEAKGLVKKGVKELILVAQDTTKYGTDLNKKTNIITLLDQLEKIDGLEKIKLLYCYPDNISDELIKKIKTSKKICHYIDMPLQHASDSVLKAMNRHTSKEQIENIILKLKKEIPDIAIRTTFIIGFPGETKKDIVNLCEFLKKHNLQNVGFFKYSREKNTPADLLDGHIPEKEKTARLKKVQAVQSKIMEVNLKKRHGKIYDVFVDDITEKTAICHGDFEVPGIDCPILIPAFSGNVGDKVKIIVIDSTKTELIGKIINVK